MLPHNLPPVPGKVYQFTTSAGIVQFRVEMLQKTGFDGEPYLVFPCTVVRGKENLDRFNWSSINIYSQCPGWVFIGIDDGPSPEYPYTPCNEA